MARIPLKPLRIPDGLAGMAREGRRHGIVRPRSAPRITPRARQGKHPVGADRRRAGTPGSVALLHG
jgi:hypothetical protein